MTALVVVVVVAGLAFVLGRQLLAEPGPNAVLTLVKRYSVWPWVAVVGAVVLAAGYVVAPRFVAMVTAAALWSGVAAALWNRWSPWTVVRAVRRIILRSRWPSVARASDLATRRDRRSREWPGGAVSTLASETVEWLPTIAHGRALPDGTGVRYRLRPARGGTLADVAEKAEALAAGLKVSEVVIDASESPFTGTLDVLWSDLLAAPVIGGEP